MAIAASVIKTIVENEDDFGFEMRVGGILREIHWAKVDHGGTYTDPQTEKPRQFDYRFLMRNYDYTRAVGCGETRLALAVECKNLNPSFPIIVCGTSRNDSEAFDYLVLSKGLLNAAVAQTFSSSRLNGKRSFYPPNEFVGKSILRLKPENNKPNAAPVVAPDTDVYERWSQAIHSATDLVEAACYCAEKEKTVWTAVLPVVVVPDDSLWKADYNADGLLKSDPELISHCSYYVDREIQIGGTPPASQAFAFSHFHFFTITAFRAFLSDMTQKITEWGKLFDAGFVRLGH